MASSVPSAPTAAPHTPSGPITMFGPDFPFAYDDWVRHPAGLGRIPEEHHGSEVAIIGGGLAGMLAGYELMKLGLRPVIYEADRIGGRLRTERFDGLPESAVAEMGAMRFPPSSTTLYHYIDGCGLQTRPFPNPLTPATPSTVIDLKGETHYARTIKDLPPQYAGVARAWDGALERAAALHEMQAAIRARDVAAIKAVWDPLVEELDDVSFYGFLAGSDQFARFADRELFGQVGFGTGGWDTDFPNSMLEILRVVYTGADDEHRSIVGGTDQLPLGLWNRAPAPGEMAHWPEGTTLASLHGGEPRPAVVELHRTAPANITVWDAAGDVRTYPAAIFTAQGWLLLSRIRVDEGLFPTDVWTAIERTHYMQSSKTFVAVDRPFWRDVDPATGRECMSMTLTDRMPRGTYLLDGDGEDSPAVMCLSYTWTDDSSKWLVLDVEQRVEVALQSLRAIYPTVDIRRHIVASPVTISWEAEPWFMGAFKANLPGHYRYQRRLYTHFMQDSLDPRHRGIFLAGDDVSWTAGWAEGAVQTALNAVWGVTRHFGGSAPLENPGPGDRFADLAPVELPDP
jgi:tryptophan 2-monooxygenase